MCVGVFAKQVFLPWVSCPSEPPPCRIMGLFLCQGGKKTLCAFIEYLLCDQELAVRHPAVTVTGARSSSGQSEVSEGWEGRSVGESGWAWLRHRARGWKGLSLRGVFSSTSSPWLPGRNGGPVLPDLGVSS